MKKINEGLPEELSEQLVKNEEAYYFSYITYKGGCGSTSSREDYWIAITNKRVFYKARVMENNNNHLRLVDKEGTLPLEKISFIEITEMKEKSGCSNAKGGFELRISTSGGTINIPVPTKEKGNEIRSIFLKITEETQQKKTRKHNE